MSFWIVINIVVDLILFAGISILWIKLNRPQKDDPRMSRGLQLLQSKMAVLEDLSDRVDRQVNQVNTLLEGKVREVQSQMTNADRQIEKIDQSMNKSLEVAKIFQDKIPHEEIIERQNSIKYVKAAMMAHQGASVEDISQEVNLTRGEIELVAKMNRQNLQFSEADLPGWAQEAIPEAHKSLSELGNKFRQAIPNQIVEDSAPVVFQPKPIVANQPMPPLKLQSLDELRKHEQQVARNSQVGSNAPTASQNQAPQIQAQVQTQTNRSQPIVATVTERPKVPRGTVQPVRFPRITLN